jgi:hypothetical protein
VARRLTAAGNRRQFLAIAISAIAAFVHTGLRAKIAAQESCPGGCAESELCTERGCVTPCANHRDCRNKHDDPCVSNMCIDGVCVSAIVDCLPGHECCEGECCVKSCDFDTECAVSDPCLWSRCGAEGKCEFTELNPCLVCTTDQECAGSGQNTMCCGGACQRPCPEGMMMGKGCECQAIGLATLDGVVVYDDASG